MKTILSKIKKTFKNFMTGKSGFSLVELIVVIAIMAVMAAVLAPALLGYVEKSRAQKDSSAMDEVTNAITLSVADTSVYDEVSQYAVKDNYSCYCDGDTSTNTDANKIITKSPDYWLFNDNARLLDETVYKPAGKMRGVTITFKPNGSAEYILKDGIVNKIGDDSTAKGADAGLTLADAKYENLYNRLCATVGDTIEMNSQTYRNSTYTIFISMGTTGGNQTDKQDAIQVYGQYNGTNLPEVMTATGSATQDKGNAGGSGQPGGGSSDPAPELNPSGIIPEGATYTKADGTVLNAGAEFPTVSNSDKYEYGDYIYTLSPSLMNQLGYSSIDELKANANQVFGASWDELVGSSGMTEEKFIEYISVAFVQVSVKDRDKEEYGSILESVNGYPVNYMQYTFSGCSNLKVAPEIPDSVQDLEYAFNNCTSLTTAPKLPGSLVHMDFTFMGCNSLVNAPDLSNCTKLDSITHAFEGCSSLTKAPTIPKNVTNISYAFTGCSSLSGSITINTTPEYYYCCLENTQVTEILGDCAVKNEILATK